jgi:hypothetical protein
MVGIRKARLSEIDSEILEAATVDSTIQGCVQLLKDGDLEYQGMLEMAVLQLLGEKRCLQRELINKIAHRG